MAGEKRWIRNADVVVTMDSDRRELAGADILAVAGRIESVGAGGPQEPAGWEVIEAGGCVVTPALVNTHHHLFQTLTRAVPACQDALLFGWLRSLYPVWARPRPEDVFVAAQLGLAELALSGCGMTSDHHYIFPDGVRLEHTIEAAATVGLRLHATRGDMSIGESAGGLPPDGLTEREADILDDCVRVVDGFHDASGDAMVRVGVAPIEAGKRADLAIWDVSGLGAAGAWDPVAALVLCGPFTVRDLLVEGRAVVRDGELTTVDPVAVAEAARRRAARLAS